MSVNSASVVRDGYRYSTEEYRDVRSRIHVNESIAKGANSFIAHAAEAASWTAMTAVSTGAGAVTAYARLSGPEKAAVAAGVAACYNQCCGGCVLQ